MATIKTSVTLDADVVTEARSYGLNVSASAQKGLEDAVRGERHRRLKEELRPEIEALNRYFEENGLPLWEMRAYLREPE